MSKVTERTMLIVQRRIDGEEYKDIASGMLMQVGAVRMACLRAMWKGRVTPEQIRYSPAHSHVHSDEEYNERWLSRLADRSYPGNNGCIEVRGFHNEDGYAQLSHRSLGVFAHRVVTILKKGPIPPNKMACHDCGNHGCVNEDHLYIGTMKQNARDTVNHGRHLEANKTHCIHGHPFDEENTRICKKGKRHCKTCEKRSQNRPEYRQWQREYQKKRRALKRALRQTEASP